jgi:pyruvate kinase
MEPPASLAEWNEWVDAFLLSSGLAKRGDPIVLVAGRPLGKAKATNTIAVHAVGDLDRGYRAHR